MEFLRFIFFVFISLTLTNGLPILTKKKYLEQQQKNCTDLHEVNNVYYLLDEIKNVSGIPADISVHWKTGNVFFTLISEEMKMNLVVLHPSGDLETIKVAGLGQSTTVDNLNDIVYLASDNGVYKYKDDGTIELYTALGEDVMYLAVSNDGSTMYIATWPQNRVHKITTHGQKQETFSVIPNGHGLTIDTRNNIYFVATKTSYILKNGFTIPIKIKGLPNDMMTAVFVSRSDEVYGMDENSNLYTIDPDNASAKFVGSFNINGVNTFGMDSGDNILIGVKGSIIKFNVHEKNPCTANLEKNSFADFKKTREIEKAKAIEGERKRLMLSSIKSKNKSGVNLKSVGRKALLVAEKATEKGNQQNLEVIDLIKGQSSRESSEVQSLPVTEFAPIKGKRHSKKRHRTTTTTTESNEAEGDEDEEK